MKNEMGKSLERKDVVQTSEGCSVKRSGGRQEHSTVEPDLFRSHFISFLSILIILRLQNGSQASSH